MKKLNFKYMFDFSTFYKGLFHRTDYFDGYLDKYPEGREKKNKEQIINLLNENLRLKDSGGLAHTLTVAYLDGVDEDYTDLLLYLLKQDWHQLQEDVIDILEMTKDPKSIDTLYKFAINIPDYDDGRSIAKKCIWALGSINTPEAIEKLTLLKSFDDPIIKKAAIMELEHKTK
jgi:hypothetical protein